MTLGLLLPDCIQKQSAFFVHFDELIFNHPDCNKLICQKTKLTQEIVESYQFLNPTFVKKTSQIIGPADLLFCFGTETLITNIDELEKFRKKLLLVN